MGLDANVLLGVCGGAAAYKAVELASSLTAQGATVRAVLTASATKLVTARSFETVTGQPAYTDMWATQRDLIHIKLADWAQVVVVAPATANCLAKLATGICDDLLCTLLCVCWQRPVLLAPAMNTRMWSNPVVQRNVKAVQEMGFRLIGPEYGRLACGEEGLGRMAEPAKIAEAVAELLGQRGR
ncbi:MAG: flavoprotein [Sedimentisphaerales bacterium]|nr:flavoprotein [Sedimentisphaerales bacterium]